MRVLIGTYSEPIVFGTDKLFSGNGKGLYDCVFDGEQLTVRHVMPMGNPSFMALDEERGMLYAVRENKTFAGTYGGGISEVMIGNGSVSMGSSFPTGGTDPCHVAIDPFRHWIAVANYGDGSVSFFALDDSGHMTGKREHFQHTGQSVDPVRQSAAHAHQVIFDRHGYAWVTDLGCDMVMPYAVFRDHIAPCPEKNVQVVPGSGPRAGVFSSDGRHFYLIQELGSCVTHFRIGDDQTMMLAESVSTLPDGSIVGNTAADIQLAKDGTHLYASNRGHDSVCVYHVDGNGCLKTVEIVPCHGRTPRHMALSPDGRWLLVGHQNSDSIAVFHVLADGRLAWDRNLPFPTPVCIRFVNNM